MQVECSESIILKNQDFKERDRLVTFLARDKGRMAGIARGARKITGRGIGSYEPFSRGMIYYVEKQSSELVAIRKCDLLPPFLFLQNDYDKFLYAGYLTELIYLCQIPPSEAEGFFQLLAKGLGAVYAEKSRQSLPLLRIEFDLDLMSCLGIQPDWSLCGECRRLLIQRVKGGLVPLVKGAYQFDNRLGGLRCPDCLKVGPGIMDISVGSIIFLLAWRDESRKASLHPTRNALMELTKLTGSYLTYQLEREPKSLSLLPPIEQAGHAPAGRS